MIFLALARKPEGYAAIEAVGLQEGGPAPDDGELLDYCGMRKVRNSDASIRIEMKPGAYLAVWSFACDVCQASARVVADVEFPAGGLTLAVPTPPGPPTPENAPEERRRWRVAGGWLICPRVHANEAGLPR